MRAPRVADSHSRQEQANIPVSNSVVAIPCTAGTADTPATQLQRHAGKHQGHAVKQQGNAAKQQRLQSQNRRLTKPPGKGQNEGNVLQLRHAVTQHGGTGEDVAASMSEVLEQRDGDKHDSKVFLDSVDCLDID